MGEATYSIDEQRTPRHPLAQGARPAAIRAALLPEDQLEFDQALAAAPDELTATLDLVPLFSMLDQWRRIAALQSDPERFARVAHRAVAINTGQQPPRTHPSRSCAPWPGCNPAAVYEIVTHDEARAQLNELPHRLLAHYLEAPLQGAHGCPTSRRPTRPSADPTSDDVGRSRGLLHPGLPNP